MTLTRAVQQTVVERLQRDPAFAIALLDEAATRFLSGEPDAARLILRDLMSFAYNSAIATLLKRAKPVSNLTPA
jgi:hypothetical protein